MKLITAAFLALTISTGALAAKVDDPDAVCTALGEMAASFQNSRQLGVPLATAAGTLDGVDLSGVPGLKDVVRQIMFDAYKQPRYEGEAMQQAAVDAFQADVMEKCYRATSK